MVIFSLRLHIVVILCLSLLVSSSPLPYKDIGHNGFGPTHIISFYINYLFKDSSLIVQLVKNLPAMQETRVRSLGQENALEKQMATHSSILASRIPWTEEPGRLQSIGSQEMDTILRLIHHTTTSIRASLVGELVKNPPAM